MLASHAVRHGAKAGRIRVTHRSVASRLEFVFRTPLAGFWSFVLNAILLSILVTILINGGRIVGAAAVDVGDVVRLLFFVDEERWRGDGGQWSGKSSDG
jgi:uncharacterized membrane protein